MRGHNRLAMPILFLVKVAGLGGSQMLLDCTKDFGIAKRARCAMPAWPLRTKLGVYLMRARYLDEKNTVRTCIPNFSPSCSWGFDKMYPHYVNAANFTIGTVGKAWTVTNSVQHALKTDSDILEKNPRAVLCDRDQCVYCQLLRGYNKRAILEGIYRVLRHWLKGSRL